MRMTREDLEVEVMRSVTKVNPLCASTVSTMLIAPMRKKTIWLVESIALPTVYGQGVGS
jgi:hypothetical protein